MQRSSSVLSMMVMCLWARPGDARLHHRVPAFEPTDLELEAPGTLELDTQFGVMVRDDTPKTRLFVPDFEIDFGLTSRVEFDLDGSLALDRNDGGYDVTGDSLWTSVKLGLWSDRDDDAPDRVFALGTQLGPRLATAANSKGTGFGLVLLASRMAPPWHVIVNAGTILEPLDRTSPERSAAVVGGLDLARDLGADGAWSLLGEVGGSYSLGPDPHDIHATLGVSVALFPWLDASLVGFYGFLAGGDRYGLFVGLAPSFDFNGASSASRSSYLVPNRRSPASPRPGTM